MKFKNVHTACLCLAALALPASAAIIGGSNQVVETYFANPHAQACIVSFDWDAASNLYYTTGGVDWDTGFSVFHFDGTTSSSLYSDPDAFAGSRLTAIAGLIYFNDGGTYDRWTCNYFRYNPATGAAPVDMGILSDIWGLETKTGSDFWAAGGYPASIYYSALDANNELVDNPLINLGAVGSASGPMAFDKDGNLYYAEGYVAEGHPNVYRWSAAEVAAAIADPEGAALNPEGHTWTTLTTGDGTTSMVVDNDGHVLVTITSFVDSSELQRLHVKNGEFTGFDMMARSSDRLETVRIRNNNIYVSAAEGIYKIVPIVTQARPINDYDGDGKSDLVVYDDASGSWYAYSLSRDEPIIWDHAWGWQGAQTVQGDYDGDGISDLCVYNQNDGTWYAWSHTRQDFIIWGVEWGWPGAIPVPGDYDGDGIYDLALFDSLSGNWYIRTISGTVLAWEKQWGWQGANPVGAAR